MTGFTQELLDQLEVAIATGALRVQYEDRTLTYRTLGEMLKARDFMRRKLGLAPAGPVRKVMAHKKGLDTGASPLDWPRSC